MSCNNSNEGNSYWEGQRGGFKYFNKTDFLINEEIKNNLTAFKKVGLKLEYSIDSVYLYSWQEREPVTNEFTVIVLEGKYGLSLFYVIMDKNDSLIGYHRIAGTNNEGNGHQMISASFFSKDSFNIVTKFFNNQVNEEDPPDYTHSDLHFITPEGEIAIIKEEITR